MNYTQLSQAIQDYTEVNEASFVSYIPTFVQNVERLVAQTVQLPVFRKAVTGAFTPLDQYITLPADFISIFSLADVDATGAFQFMKNKDVNYIREAYPSPASVGLPTCYALFNSCSVLVGPTPDAAYVPEMHYQYYPPSIVDVGTTWLSTNFPNVLLWGAVLEAYAYLKGDADLLNLYSAKYQEALGLLKQLGDGKDRMDTYRTVQVRDQVK